MVVLVILAMLVFTLDALFTAQGQNFWLLGLLLGGVVCGIAGIGSGRWLQWGIIGGLVGAVVGLSLPELNKPPGVIDFNFGMVEQEELQDLFDRRSVANGFMQLAAEEAFGPGGRQFVRPFGFGHPSQREDLLFGRLMQEEADALGVTVTDDMVSTYVNKRTADRLSGEGFGRSRRALTYKGSPVRSEALFDILREQIRNEITYMALVPTGSVSPPSPDVHWEYFQRMNVRQAIHVAEFDVDAFLDQVDEPTDAEIEGLFATASSKQPNQDGLGSPGFALPGRARIAWLEQDYDSMESQVPPVTDQEIEAFYNENRNVRYRSMVVPEDSGSETEPTPDTDTTPAEQDLPPGDVAPESLDQSRTESESSTETGSDEKPLSDENDLEEPVVEGSEFSEESESTEPRESESFGSEPSVDKTPTEPTDSGGQFSIDDPVSEADVPETQDSVDIEESVNDTDNASETTVEDAGISVESAIPFQLKVPDESESDAGDESLRMEPEWEYRELDDDLRNEIRDELLQERVRQATGEKMLAGWGFLNGLQSELRKDRDKYMEENRQKYLDDPEAADLDLRREMAKNTPEILKKMENYAGENKLVYAATDLVSFQQFSDRDDYPLGMGVQPDLPAFQLQSVTDAVAYKVFSGFSMDVSANDGQLFVPERAVSEPMTEDGTSSQYVYWIVEFEEPHIPTLEEHGVREQVQLAFKREKAREVLMERAEKLAQDVREGLEKPEEERLSMTDKLESESITGREGSATLTVRSSESFSWLRLRETPATSFRSRGPRTELSTIRFVDGSPALAGIRQEFMRTVFEELGDDEVGIVPNHDRTRYFLVHVTDRFPTLDSGIDGLHNRFAVEGRMNFMTSPVMGLMSGEIVTPVVMEWEREIWRKYGVDPDVDPGES